MELKLENKRVLVTGSSGGIGAGIARKFAHGGAVPTSVGVLSGQQQIESAINLDNFSDKIIEGFNDKEVINVSTNTTEVAQDVINIQTEATF